MKKITIILTVLIFFQAKAQITFTTQVNPSNQHLLGVSFADSLIGYACGMNGALVKTTDGGVTWNIQTTGTTNHLNDLKVLPGSSGQKIVAVGDNNTVIKSVDGGLSWVSQTIPFQVGSFVFGLQCLDSLNYFAVGGNYATFSGAILKTTDGGANWTTTPVGSTIFLDKIVMFDQDNGFAVGTNNSFTGGSVVKISSGPNFSPVKSVGALITNLWCMDTNTLVAVGLGGQIHKSTDGGATWNDHSFNTIDLYDVEFTDSLCGYACGGDQNGHTILTSTNGGINWTQITYSNTARLQSIDIKGRYIYMVGDFGTIIKGTLPAKQVEPPISTIVVEEDKVKAKAVVYPNPVSSSISIKTDLNYDHVVLLDIQGKTVLSEKNANDMSLKNVPAGIYYVSFLNKNNHSLYTVKVVKE